MSSVTTILLLIIIIINSILRKKIFEVTNLFLFGWAVIVAFSGINLININEISAKTYFIVCIGCISFFFGAILLKNVRSVNLIKVKILKRDSPNYQLLISFAWIHFLVSMYFVSKAIRFLGMGYSFSSLRGIYQGYITTVTYSESLLDKFFINWIEGPLNMILPFIALVLFIRKRPYKLFYLLTGLTEIAYYVYCQSRFALIYICIAVVILFWINRNKMSNRLKRGIVCMSLVIVGAFLFMTINRFRHNSFVGLGEVWGTYLYGGLRLLDYGIKDIDSRNYYAYGGNFFYGVVFLLEKIMDGIKLGYSSYYEELLSWQENKEIFLSIGANIRYNAFYTVFYDFYMDFHTTGVVLGGGVLGVISEININKKLSEQASDKDIVFSLMYITVLVMTIIRWQFVYIPFCASFIYLILLFSVRPIRIKT